VSAPGPDVFKANGAAAQQIIASLRSTPTLLVMVLLNIAIIGIAGWYLNNQEHNRFQTLNTVLKLIGDCHDQKGRLP
jgi:hypothetical protein